MTCVYQFFQMTFSVLHEVFSTVLGILKINVVFSVEFGLNNMYLLSRLGKGKGFP